MTFEQWWEKFGKDQMRDIYKKPADSFAAIEDSFRTATILSWNAALGAAQVQMDRIERQIREPQDPPVTDLSTWIMFYRSRFARALQLIAAKKP